MLKINSPKFRSNLAYRYSCESLIVSRMPVNLMFLNDTLANNVINI